MQYLVRSHTNIVCHRSTPSWLPHSILYRFQVRIDNFRERISLPSSHIKSPFLLCRRDRGVTTQNVVITYDNYLNQSRTAFGETIFVFVVPSLLHFAGFLSAVYVLRIVDNEQLQNLVERVSDVAPTIFGIYFNHRAVHAFRCSYCVNYPIACSSCFGSTLRVDSSGCY